MRSRTLQAQLHPVLFELLSTGYSDVNSGLYADKYQYLGRAQCLYQLSLH
jgi:hypothetical protein